jgi:hypothetical protein
MSTALLELEQYEKQFFDPQTDDPSLLPDEAGIYAVCVKDENTLCEISTSAIFPIIKGRYVLYVGISETQGLRDRDYKNHFNGTARNSTLRKSLGSLFGWRGDRIYYADGKYKFSPERERELNEWMHCNLAMFYWPNITDIDNLETRLINEIDPPINIAKNKSPINAKFRAALTALRK